LECLTLKIAYSRKLKGFLERQKKNRFTVSDRQTNQTEKRQVKVLLIDPTNKTRLLLHF